MESFFVKDNSLLVSLPDGWEANVTTEAGANDILPHLGGFIVQMAVQARLGTVTDDELLMYYHVFEQVAMHCSPEAFQTHLTPKQLDCLIGHLVENFQHIARDATWVQSGEMKRHHQELLIMSAAYFQHQYFVQRVLASCVFFPALAKTFAALQGPALSSHQIGIESLLVTVSNLFLNGTSREGNLKTMQLLEATGVLGQFIRLCATDHKYQSAVVPVLDRLSLCTMLLQKKFKSGKAGGGILNSILSGEDGYSGKRNEAVLSQLLNLQKLANMTEKKDSLSVIATTCRNCSKGSLTSEDTMFCCARCADADYCSKECQTEDWKRHKKSCTSIKEGSRKAFLKAKENNNRIFTSWFVTYGRMITDQMEISMKKESVDMQDLLIEVDFLSVDGIALALKDPPEFKIGVIRNYLEGKSPFPSWFIGRKKGEDEAFLASLKEACSKLVMNKEKKESENDPFLFLVRLPDGTPKAAYSVVF
jgi:hypothetical protein